jgi:hypothetical protein
MGSANLVKALGAARVVLGFPGAGGTLEGHVVRYALIAQQPTTIGEPDGGQTNRLRALEEALRASGFKTRIDCDMNSWLLSHAHFVTAVSGAIYLAGGDCDRLSRSRPLLRLMVSGVREGFNAVHRLGHAVHPFSLGVLFSWLPRPFAIYYWRRFFSNRMAEYVFARHALHASVEMLALAAECRLLVDKSGVPAPALNQLYRAIDTQLKPDRQDLAIVELPTPSLWQANHTLGSRRRAASTRGNLAQSCLSKASFTLVGGTPEVLMPGLDKIQPYSVQSQAAKVPFKPDKLSSHSTGSRRIMGISESCES